MSLAIPKKKKVIIIIIVAATVLQADLDNNIDGTLQETLIEHLAAAQFCLFNVDENQWETVHQEAWQAIDDIHTAINGTSTSDPNWQELVDNLGAKLAEL